MDYAEILPFEYKRERVCSTKHFCSNSREVLKGDPKNSMLIGDASQVTAGAGNRYVLAGTDQLNTALHLYKCAAENCCIQKCAENTKEWRNTSLTYRCFNISSNKNCTASWRKPCWHGLHRLLECTFMCWAQSVLLSLIPTVILGLAQGHTQSGVGLTPFSFDTLSNVGRQLLCPLWVFSFLSKTPSAPTEIFSLYWIIPIGYKHLYKNKSRKPQIKTK